MRQFVSASVLAAFALATGPAAAAPCPTDDLGKTATRLAEGKTTVAYRTVPEKIEVGTLFRLEVIACHDGRTAPSRIRVDAGMPMHGHGMNYTPTERRIAPGHSEFDGLMLHMPGEWVLTFDIYDGEARTRIAQKVRISR